MKDRKVRQVLGETQELVTSGRQGCTQPARILRRECRSRRKQYDAFVEQRSGIIDEVLASKTWRDSGRDV